MYKDSERPGKILVTGSSAVAGTGLKNILQDYPEREVVYMTSSDCDLTNWEATHAFLADYRPEGIIHLAAVSGGIGLSAKHHASMLRDNVLMTFNILEAARLLGTRKVVMTLTAGAYPPDAPLPLKEEYLHNGLPAENNYGSSFAKRLIEPAIRGYREEYGLSVVGLIPGGIFGENDNFNYDDAPMLPALIRRFYENKDEAGPIMIWGDGTPRREYTYAGDIGRIFMWAMDNYDQPECLNIGSTEENSIAEIAGMIADEVGVDRGRIKFDPDKPNGVFRRSTDNSRFIEQSGFSYISFREGLARTVNWFKDTYENDRSSLRLYKKTRARGEAGVES